MSKTATPRVNASTLKSHVGGTVRIVGRVKEMDGKRVALETSDGGVAFVNANPERLAPYTDVVEVCGTVQPDGSVTEQHVVQFGPNFDLALYQRALELTRGKNYKQLFQ